MKTISRILMILSIALLTACQGEQGPPGIPGQDGQDGYNILGSVFETDPVTFTLGNEYSTRFDFPSNFEIYASDVVMVYSLWGQDNGEDVWRALPQTIFLDQGTFQYNFDYTVSNVYIYLDLFIDPIYLTPGDTDNQIFRIAVIPADLVAQNKSLDIKDYNAVMKALKLPSDNAIQKIQLDSVLKK